MKSEIARGYAESLYGLMRNALNVLIDQGRAHLIQEVAEETFHD